MASRDADGSVVGGGALDLGVVGMMWLVLNRERKGALTAPEAATQRNASYHGGPGVAIIINH